MLLRRLPSITLFGQTFLPNRKKLSTIITRLCMICSIPKRSFGHNTVRIRTFFLNMLTRFIPKLMKVSMFMLKLRAVILGTYLMTKKIPNTKDLKGTIKVTIWMQTKRLTLTLIRTISNMKRLLPICLVSYMTK